MIDPFQWGDVDLQASDNTGIFRTSTNLVLD